MPATQRKCIYGGLTLDVDRHYIGSITATTHQEKGIITLESNPSNIQIQYWDYCRSEWHYDIVIKVIYDPNFHTDGTCDYDIRLKASKPINK